MTDTQTASTIQKHTRKVLPYILIVYLLLLFATLLFGIFASALGHRLDFNIFSVLFGNQQSIINNTVYKMIISIIWGSAVFILRQRSYGFIFIGLYLLFVMLFCFQASVGQPLFNSSILFKTYTVLDFVIKPVVMPVVVYLVLRIPYKIYNK